MNLNKEFFLFLKSTFTVFITSILISLGVWMLHGNFLAAFILTFTIQYILFSFVGSMINNYFNQKTKQKELDKLENLSSLLECAFCKKPNVITFIPDENERVEFVCESCKGKNIVNLNFTVARMTDMIPLNTLPKISEPTKSIDTE
jgi:hypothetical protein